MLKILQPKSALICGCGRTRYTAINIRHVIFRGYTTDDDQVVCNDAKSDISLDQSVKLARQACHKDLDNAKMSNRRKFEDNSWITPQGQHTGVTMYNSYTRKKEPFILPREGVVNWYACGPTVYDKAHIGHASSYVRTDVIRRVLEHNFHLDVVLVMGVTDIDDKIIARSNEENVGVRDVARKYEMEFFSNMRVLGVAPPSVTTRVTEHIPHIVAFIQRIVHTGCAYVHEGSVYFDVLAFGRYGRLSSQRVAPAPHDGQEAEFPGKRSPRDFALWKAAKPQEPWWDSPWGRGRPGWHIECSAMASSIFGERLDVHSGGADLMFPHHENELAQCEACFSSHQWTNYWLHTGHLHLGSDADKMSKSLKNTVWVHELLEKFTPDEFRLFCILIPYRQLIRYSADSMEKAVSIMRTWRSFLASADAYVTGQSRCQPVNEPYLHACLSATRERVRAALADDFSTHVAVTALQDLVRRTNAEINRRLAPDQAALAARSPAVVAAIAAYLERTLASWGFQTVTRHAVTSRDDAGRHFSDVVDAAVTFRGKVRQFARNTDNVIITDAASAPDKAWQQRARQQLAPLMAACDELRTDLAHCGVTVQDQGNTATWSIKEKLGASDE